MPDLYALAELLDLSPDEADLLATTIAAERRRGRDEGALRAFKSVASANGSTQGVLAVLKGTFDESEHPRDHGRFAEKEGAKGGAQHAPESPRFPTLGHADAWGKRHFGEWGDGLSKEENWAVNAYIGGGYADINGSLRDGTPLDKMRGKTAQVVEHLDAAIARGFAPHAMTTYRGVRGAFADELVQLARSGGALADPAYLSTSLVEKQAVGFVRNSEYSRAVLEIAVPEGSSGVYPDVLDIGGEGEWLMPRGTKLLLSGARQGDDGVWRITATVGTAAVAKAARKLRVIQRGDWDESPRFYQVGDYEDHPRGSNNHPAPGTAAAVGADTNHPVEKAFDESKVHRDDEGKFAKHPTAPTTDDLAKKPGGDKKVLKRIIADAPTPEIKEFIEDAHWNADDPAYLVRNAPDGMGGVAVRRDTVNQLAASWRAAHDQGKHETADYLAGVLEHFGAVLHGVPGDEVPFDPLHHDAGGAPTSTGQSVTLARPAVLLPESTGDYVAARGAIENTVGKALDPDPVDDDTDPDDTDLYDGDGPGAVRKASEPGDEPNLLLLTALVGAVHDAMEDGGDVEAVAESFRPLIDDPDELARVLSGTVGKSSKGVRFDPYLHPRDDHGRFVSRDAIHDAKEALKNGDSSKADALRAKVTGEIEREKLDDALEGKSDLGRTQAHKKREEVAKRRADKAKTKQRADELIRKVQEGKVRGTDVSGANLHALVDHLPHMTVADLRRARLWLDASFGGGRRKAQMVERLKAHVAARFEEEANASVKQTWADYKPGGLFSGARQRAIANMPTAKTDAEDTGVAETMRNAPKEEGAEVDTAAMRDRLKAALANLPQGDVRVEMGDGGSLRNHAYEGLAMLETGRDALGKPLTTASRRATARSVANAVERLEELSRGELRHAAIAQTFGRERGQWGDMGAAGVVSLMQQHGFDPASDDYAATLDSVAQRLGLPNGTHLAGMLSGETVPANTTERIGSAPGAESRPEAGEEWLHEFTGDEWQATHERVGTGSHRHVATARAAAKEVPGASVAWVGEGRNRRYAVVKPKVDGAEPKVKDEEKPASKWEGVDLKDIPDKEERAREFERRQGHKILTPSAVWRDLAELGYTAYQRGKPRAGVAGRSGVTANELPGKKTVVTVQTQPASHEADGYDYAGTAGKLEQELTERGYAVSRNPNGDPHVLYVRKPLAPEPPQQPAPTAVADTRVDGKEPWEMSVREWEDARDKFRTYDSGGGVGRVGPQVDARNKTRLLTQLERGDKLRAGLNPIDDDTGLPRHVQHRDVLEHALEAGKPVPAHVLADYPDLAAKYGKAPEPAAPSRASATSPAMGSLTGAPAPGAPTGGGWMPGASTARKVEPSRVSATSPAMAGAAVDGSAQTWMPGASTGRKIERDSSQQEGVTDGAATRTGAADRGAPGADLGGADFGSAAGTLGGTGDRPARPRIVTAREHLTRPSNPDVVPESVRQHLNEAQVHGASLAIDAMEKHGGFLLADGTGVGKTRQQLAVAKKFLDDGKKVVIISPAEVIKPDWKKGTTSGSFANDAAAMGIGTTLAKGDAPLAAGRVHLTTYNELSKLKSQIDKNTVVLFDESHAMKNRDSARHKHGKEIAEKAGAVMYSTATPGDKPLHIAHLARAGVFGNAGSTKTFEKLGMQLVDQHIGGGEYRKVWQVNPKIGHQESLRRMSGLFDQMTRDGLMVKRELSMHGVDVGLSHIPLTPSQHDEINKVYNDAMAKHDGNKAVSLMAARLHQEPMKIPHTVSAVQQELAEGRSPVVFVGRVNDIGGSDDEEGESAGPESVGTAKALKAALIAAGVPESDIGELHGGATTTAAQKKKAMDEFQSNKKKVMIATVQSGGTGINLDDTTGTRPRTVVMTTPPFTANDMAQAIGRVHRLNTKSASRVRGILSDTEIDRWNGELLKNKFKTLGAIAGGESARGAAAIGGEHEEGGAAEPYQWGESLHYKPKPRLNTPFQHNDLLGQFGAKRVKVGDNWTTEFPDQESLDRYHAHVAPKAAPAAAAPAPSKYKRVATANGERSVHTIAPSKAYWNNVHKNRPDYVSVRKNPRTNDWELSVWGKNDEEVERNLADLRRRM